MKKSILLPILVFLFSLTSCGFYHHGEGSIPVGPDSETETESESESESNPGSESESEVESESTPDKPSENESEKESENEPEKDPVVPDIPKENEDFDGYYRLYDNKLVYDEFTPSAPHTGEAKMLVIPLKFTAGAPKYSVSSFTATKLQNMNNYFFGKKEDTPNSWNSLKTYFETTSLNQLSVSGIVTDPYEVGSTYTVKKICEQDNENLEMLQTVFKSAVEWVKSNHNEDWSSYDMNDDKFFDSVHFITNLNYNTTLEGANQPFWPHKWEILDTGSGSLNSPLAKTYETTALGHLEDAETIIHEQSHVFGIMDYYDYSYSGVDYVGCLDMQSHNEFDWNSFSKFSVGWTNPFVIDGTKNSTTVTIESAALTNQCLVVPANHSTFNGSAFDEYILIELFTNEGNNAGHWNTYFSNTTYGIRLYHVDARLVSYYYEKEITNLEEAKSLFSRGDYVDVGCNNSYKYDDYMGLEAWADYKLLTLIQKGGTNTFGEVDGSESYDFLSKGDMFYTGDTFTFAKYKHFFSKKNKTVTTMDNGETFPWTITFDSVSKSSATITVSKN